MNMTELNIESYQNLYRMALELSYDAESFGLFENILDIDIEKAKYIYAIMEVMSDVPLRRAEHIMQYKKVKFDYFELLESAFAN